MHTIQQQKTPKWFKAVQESEQTFFHRRHSDCQRKNANQNHNESIASCLLEWLLTKKKTRDNKGWLECGENRTLGHSWWECKLM